MRLPSEVGGFKRYACYKELICVPGTVLLATSQGETQICKVIHMASGPTHWHWPVYSVLTGGMQTESNSLLTPDEFTTIIMVANKGMEHKVTPK